MTDPKRIILHDLVVLGDRLILRTAVTVAAFDSRLPRWKRLLQRLLPFYHPFDYWAHAAYICDGVDDQVKIQAALDSLPPEGGTVLLSPGHFSCGVDQPRLRTDDKRSLRGPGKETILDYGVRWQKGCPR